VKKLRDDGKGGAIARFAEITDRNGAEGLRGTELVVPRSELPALDDGEYYHADLIGLPVISDEEEAIGVVRDVQNFGAGDILEIERPNAKRFMVPMIESAVLAWDEGRVVISAAFAE
ncbi:MAG: 16S rRNA processing protein RimM, partial [Burkholderiales bacterium]